MYDLEAIPGGALTFEHTHVQKLGKSPPFPPRKALCCSVDTKQSLLGQSSRTILFLVLRVHAVTPSARGVCALFAGARQGTP